MAEVTAPLVWNENYATGVPEIDEQHMILVHTLNEASEKLAEDSSIENLQEITQNLLSYALYHFDTEEELMQEFGYAGGSEEDASSHLKQHRAFSAKVVAVRDGLKSNTPIAAEDLLAFLNDWLINHILNTDKKLGAFICEKRG
ncbi:bacteriohemerythrin [Magnetovibrio sp. PR-2]|uniref:bacteriohemerythrin n=1 Tax=Magnetovibrio sp. PR-2 TaxID=3120356 RepID=UPI002FCE4A73